MFSQTGSEIVSISKELGRTPDVIITNNMDESKYKYHPELRKLSIIQSAKHDWLMNYLENNEYIDPKNSIITLHGYLRIIPPKVCERYEMYNGHPAAIELYPELKGKDPQDRTWTDIHKYRNIGSVVHKVTPGVDEGEVVSSVNYVNRVQNMAEMYGKLRESSLQSWLFFLKRRLNENRN